MNEIYKAAAAKSRASCFHYAISRDARHSRYFLVRRAPSFYFNEKTDTRFRRDCVRFHRGFILRCLFTAFDIDSLFFLLSFFSLYLFTPRSRLLSNWLSRGTCARFRWIANTEIKGLSLFNENDSTSRERNTVPLEITRGISRCECKVHARKYKTSDRWFRARVRRRFSAVRSEQGRSYAVWNHQITCHYSLITEARIMHAIISISPIR